MIAEFRLQILDWGWEILCISDVKARLYCDGLRPSLVAYALSGLRAVKPLMGEIQQLFLKRVGTLSAV